MGVQICTSRRSREACSPQSFNGWRIRIKGTCEHFLRSFNQWYNAKILTEKPPFWRSNVVQKERKSCVTQRGIAVARRSMFDNGGQVEMLHVEGTEQLNVLLLFALVMEKP